MQRGVPQETGSCGGLLLGVGKDSEGFDASMGGLESRDSRKDHF